MPDSPLSAMLAVVGHTSWCDDLTAWIDQCAPGNVLSIKNASGSLPAFLLAHIFARSRRSLVCITPDVDGARYLHSDLEELNVPALYFPASGHTPYDQEQIAKSTPIIRRNDVLQQVAEDNPAITISSLEALQELMPPPTATQQQTRTIHVGDSISPSALVRDLVKQGFERVSFVQEPGEVAWRGGILDFFPFTGGLPVRVECFGNAIESIREFEATTQRSISHKATARLVPRPENIPVEGPWISLLDCLPADALLIVFDDPLIQSEATARYNTITSRYAALENTVDIPPAPEERYLSPEALARLRARFPKLVFETSADGNQTDTLVLESRPQPVFAGHLDRLREHLQNLCSWHIRILCDSRGQKERLDALLEEVLDECNVHLLVGSLHQGFQLPGLATAIYTDHEVFGRYHRPRSRKLSRTGGMRLQELNSLKLGDYVVHATYGIGQFVGLKKITVKGRIQESVHVVYAQGDNVYVNVNALHKLQKYTGKEGTAPALTKLGSGQWARAKSRAKKRIKDIARDLIKLYARRKASQAYAYAPDSVWQREMEASFQWEDTPDQYAAAEIVKRDMEDSAPMDRLVCGDVGFGKTEVAIRAAFKAAQEGRQVAILVPTTVLARQHYYTFKKRLENFPVRIEMLSRYITGAAVRKTLRDLAEGTVDIIVGTHRLVSKDVSFKDLGLLIIDEEQRFGVRIKEKLRQIRVNVDTLTLTATPIPRTLQFSLMGARDLSIINTPPPNRQPIQTEIHSVDWALIRNTALYEVSRGGQIFFIHNRVQSIGEIASRLRDLLPGIRLAVAHGQMKASELERVMSGFVDHTFDMLVSTSIVENGLDIANANTMIIHQAHRFGLAEIHQLRGRVGRSDKKAFCYLLVPSVSDLTRKARQRLQAVEQFSSLGSGFDIAMRDLDIRGAGNILGGEQSGFITDLGLSTYHQILEQAVQELRTEEFAELFHDMPPPPVQDTSVDVDVNASLPDSYVQNVLERLGLYRRIAETKDSKGLIRIRDELVDRFGPLPRPAKHLLRAAEMRLMAQNLRLPRIQYRNQRLFLRFPSKDEDPSFYSTILAPLLRELDKSRHQFVLKESKSNRLRAIVQNVKTLMAAYRLLKTFHTRITLDLQS